MTKSTKMVVAIGAGLITATLIAAPFITSMTPSARALANRPFIELSKIGNGEYVEFQPGMFVLRLFNGEIKVFFIPRHDDKYRLPDRTWSRAYLPCDVFGPDSTQNKLVAGGKFRCTETTLHESWSDELLWDYSGKNLGKYTENLHTPKYVIEGTSLYVEKL